MFSALGGALPHAPDSRGQPCHASREEMKTTILGTSDCKLLPGFWAVEVCRSLGGPSFLLQLNFCNQSYASDP